MVLQFDFESKKRCPLLDFIKNPVKKCGQRNPAIRHLWRFDVGNKKNAPAKGLNFSNDSSRTKIHENHSSPSDFTIGDWLKLTPRYHVYIVL